MLCSPGVTGKNVCNPCMPPLFAGRALLKIVVSGCRLFGEPLDHMVRSIVLRLLASVPEAKIKLPSNALSEEPKILSVVPAARCHAVQQVIFPDTSKIA